MHILEKQSVGEIQINIKKSMTSEFNDYTYFYLLNPLTMLSSPDQRGKQWNRTLPSLGVFAAAKAMPSTDNCYSSDEPMDQWYLHMKHPESLFNRPGIELMWFKKTFLIQLKGLTFLL